MRVPIFQIDAFADRLFTGNPAAVCPLHAWLEEKVMRRIAAENNLSETAFCVREGDVFRLRWFTPRVEVDLCGHATLACAHVLLNETRSVEGRVEFETRSGRLAVAREGDRLVMDFPSFMPEAREPPEGLAEAMGIEPREWLAAWPYVAVYEHEDQIRALDPDMAFLAKIELDGVLATAPGVHVDFVSRCFFPGAGIPEDPVTGSAHCVLAPFWADRLGKTQLVAHQLSERGGEVFCRVRGERTELLGRCQLYMRGEVELPDEIGETAGEQ